MSIMFKPAGTASIHYVEGFDNFHKMVYILVYTKRRFIMQTAKIFTNGRSQAIRLPKEYRFSGDDVYINKIGKIVVLIPKDDPWSVLANSLDQFSDDFMEDRNQPPQNNREDL